MKAVRRAAVGFVVLAAGTAGAQDLLVLRDGSRRTGALQSCVADRCHLDGRPVERADIAWIGLAAAGDAPPPAFDPQLDEVHLVDGSTELGRVVGISLGAVALESASFERDRVAWIRFRGEDAESDVLVLRSGESRLGELADCAGDSCSFDGTSWPRSNIVWIGLRRSDAAPPAASDPASDEIHLVDESVEPGPLVGIGADSVVGQRGSHPRDEVAWVYLAPPEADRSGLPDQVGAPREDPPPPPGQESPGEETGGEDGAGTPPPAPGGPSPPPDGRRPARDRPVEPCPADQPLGGKVELDFTAVGLSGGGQPDSKFDVRARLWFALAPWYTMPWPQVLGVGYYAPRIDYDIRLGDLVDHVPDERLYTGTGVSYGGSVSIEDPSLGIQFSPVGPELEMISTPAEISDRLGGEAVYVSPGGEGRGGYGSDVSFVVAQRQPCRSEVDGIQRFCVRPTGCEGADGERTPECLQRPDLYAVIPFAGSDGFSYSLTSSWPDLVQTIRTSRIDWEVCCGCGRPPSGPPPDLSQNS